MKLTGDVTADADAGGSGGGVRSGAGICRPIVASAAGIGRVGMRAVAKTQVVDQIREGHLVGIADPLSSVGWEESCRTGMVWIGVYVNVSVCFPIKSLCSFRLAAERLS